MPGLTHTQPARGVQLQALGTLAAEGASSVEAAPVQTEAGEGLAFVHIWAVEGKTEREGWRPLVIPLGVGKPRLSLGRKEGALARILGELRKRSSSQGGKISVSISKDSREDPQ